MLIKQDYVAKKKSLYTFLFKFDSQSSEILTSQHVSADLGDWELGNPTSTL